VVPQQLRATDGAFSTLVTSTVSTAYNIAVRFWGAPMTAEQQSLFTTAAARISAIVTGDLPDGNAVGTDVSVCGVSGVGALNENIDDVLIFASLQSIDGPGNTVASAGPCYIRNSDGLTIIGVMQFDSDDIGSLDQSTLQDVITHEMLHVLGFGSFWSTENFLVDTGTVNEGYTGLNGLLGCQAIGGLSTCATRVPVDYQGGEGTAHSHRRESTFSAELMTGYINLSAMPLSRMTVGALADLGYSVNYNAADPFTIPGGSIRFPSARMAPLPRSWERLPATPPRRL
jgi:hypothetical protein